MQEVDKHLQERELEHPTRLLVWEACERDPDRSLAPQDIHRDVSPTAKGPVTVSQVNYHLRRLQKVGLVRER
jgi:hypothetical protein